MWVNKYNRLQKLQSQEKHKLQYFVQNFLSLLTQSEHVQTKLALFTFLTIESSKSDICLDIFDGLKRTWNEPFALVPNLIPHSNKYFSALYI